MSTLIPLWETDPQKLREHNLSYRKLALNRYAQSCSIPKASLVINDLVSRDLNLATWSLPEVPSAIPGSEFIWIACAVPDYTLIVITGVVWIDGSLGPATMKFNVNGITRAAFDLSKIYAPLMLARSIQCCPSGALKAIAPYILERALEGMDSSDIRASVCCVGYFSEAIYADNDSYVRVILGIDRYPSGIDRQLVLMGFTVTERGLITA